MINLNMKEIGKVCERIRTQKARTMLEKIKKILHEAANSEINLNSETARALLAREIILKLYGDVDLDG